MRSGLLHVITEMGCCGAQERFVWGGVQPGDS